MVDRSSSIKSKEPPRAGSKFLGANIFNLLTNRLQFLRNLERTYGPVVAVTVARKKWLVVQHPEAIRRVLQESNRYYHKQGGYLLFEVFLGKGIATTNGQTWLQKRQLMQPAFYRSRLGTVLDAINMETTEMIESWKQCKKKHTIDINEEFLKLTLLNVTTVLFSTDIKHQSTEILNVIHELVACAFHRTAQLFNFPLAIPIPAHIRFKKAMNNFNEIIYNIIAQRKRLYKEEKEPVCNDLMDMLMQARDAETGAGMNEQQLRDEVTTFLMVGHETTAQVLSWALYELALHPQLLLEARCQVQAVTGGQALNFEHLSRLSLINAIINETLRKYPPVWAITRTCIQQDTLCGYSVPYGSSVLLNIYGVHNSPEYWENPHLFYPAHFYDGQMEQRQRYAFVPFGAGPRNCIGSHFAMVVMQVVLCRLVSTFDFQLPVGFKALEEPSITLRAKGGIKLKIRTIHE